MTRLLSPCGCCSTCARSKHLNDVFVTFCVKAVFYYLFCSKYESEGYSGDDITCMEGYCEADISTCLRQLWNSVPESIVTHSVMQSACSVFILKKFSGLAASRFTQRRCVMHHCTCTGSSLDYTIVVYVMMRHRNEANELGCIYS